MNCGEEYPSVQTFTIQSSFKYDHPFRDVANAIDMLNHSKRRAPLEIEEKKAHALIEKIKDEFQGQISRMHELVNALAPFIPERRARKLHVGLFGYSRSVKGISLPRAIKFCAAFYSLGLPPELLGLSALNDKDWEALRSLYVKLDEDLKDTVKYVNMKNIKQMPGGISRGMQKVLEHVQYEENEEYAETTTAIYQALKKGSTAALSEDIKRAAWLRKFLG